MKYWSVTVRRHPHPRYIDLERYIDLVDPAEQSFNI